MLPFTKPDNFEPQPWPDDWMEPRPADKWWEVFQVCLACGQKVEAAVRWANRGVPAEDRFYYTSTSNSPTTLSKILEQCQGANDAFEIARDWGVGMARATVHRDAAKDFGDAMKFLERRDEEFKPKSDVTSGNEPIQVQFIRPEPNADD